MLQHAVYPMFPVFIVIVFSVSVFSCQTLDTPLLVCTIALNIPKAE